eukprot:TRINITY_DN2642_c0_g1_i5.p1 TRINITY_DN2642_c0_g1~~TRINITY_DN2642_c0_g1_i5.p1  ORF type:complete len:198 (+),score=24.68 TRINITY_DN2642_c0_g1_i5:427-1020(+)
MVRPPFGSGQPFPPGPPPIRPTGLPPIHVNHLDDAGGEGGGRALESQSAHGGAGNQNRLFDHSSGNKLSGVESRATKLGHEQRWSLGWQFLRTIQRVQRADQLMALYSKDALLRVNSVKLRGTQQLEGGTRSVLEMLSRHRPESMAVTVTELGPGSVQIEAKGQTARVDACELYQLREVGERAYVLVEHHVDLNVVS